MNKKKAISLLDKIARNYVRAIRATERAHALTGKTAKALAERDKAIKYITAAACAEIDLYDMIERA
jgi:uncharacterized protein YifE (UPF0438 family)